MTSANRGLGAISSGAALGDPRTFEVILSFKYWDGEPLVARPVSIVRRQT